MKISFITAAKRGMNMVHDAFLHAPVVLGLLAHM